MTSQTSNPAMDDDTEGRGVGILEADLNGQDMRIGIVQARFNEDH